MKKILYSLLLCSVMGVKAQVKIGGTMSGTIPDNVALQLEPNGNAQGVLFPRVDLLSITQKAPITTTPSSAPLPSGLLVYNKKSDSDNNFLTKGYYYWENNQWNLINFQDFDSNFIDIITTEQLGYVPTLTTGNAVTVAGATKLRCVKWEELLGGNGHVYCLYNSTTAQSWNDAYLKGKAAGGYLPVITSNNEWNFIKNKVIVDGNGVGGGTFTANAWLGFNRDAFLQKGATVADYKYRYRWITGEISQLDWGNSTATTENQFTNTLPIPANSVSQNCGRINTTASNWSVVDCVSPTTTGLILEFNQ